MLPETLGKRVAMLESEMKELRELPAHVAELGLQIVQLRGEMRSEFSAVRSEIAGLRTDMHALNDETRTQMRVLHEDVIARLTVIREHQAAPRAARRKGPRTRSR